jgi:hypothetical protein
MQTSATTILHLAEDPDEHMDQEFQRTYKTELDKLNLETWIIEGMKAWKDTETHTLNIAGAMAEGTRSHG